MSDSVNTYRIAIAILYELWLNQSLLVVGNSELWVTQINFLTWTSFNWLPVNLIIPWSSVVSRCSQTIHIHPAGLRSRCIAMLYTQTHSWWDSVARNSHASLVWYNYWFCVTAVVDASIHIQQCFIPPYYNDIQLQLLIILALENCRRSPALWDFYIWQGGSLCTST